MMKNARSSPFLCDSLIFFFLFALTVFEAIFFLLLSCITCPALKVVCGKFVTVLIPFFFSAL